MKKNHFIILLCILSKIISAQGPVLVDTKNKNEIIALNTEQLQLLGEDEIPMKKIEPLLDCIVQKAFHESTQICNDDGSLNKYAILILVFHPLNYKGIEDTTQVNEICFRKNRAMRKSKIMRDGKYVEVDTIYNRKKILFVFLGRQVEAKSFSVKKGLSFIEADGSDDETEVNYSEKKQNATLKNNSFKVNDTTNIAIRFVRINRQKLHSPSEISFLVSDYEKITDDSLHTTSFHVTVNDDSAAVTFNVRPEDFQPCASDSSVYGYPVLFSIIPKNNPNITEKNLHQRMIYLSDKEFYRKVDEQLVIRIHEKNYVAFNIGVSANLISSKYLSYVNDSLTVQLDSSGQKQWQSAMYAGIMYYPFGRKIENYGWIFQSPFSRLPERFGFFGGFQISKTPLKRLYSGLTIALAKYINFDVGFIWDKDYVVQSKYLPGVVNFQNAELSLEQRYSPTFYIGFSFAPSLIAKYIGLDQAAQ